LDDPVPEETFVERDSFGEATKKVFEKAQV
jgi:hypothetical protein